MQGSGFSPLFLFFHLQDHHREGEPGRSTGNWDSEPQEVDLRIFLLVKVRELARQLESIVNYVICFLCVVFVSDRS